MKRLVSAAAMAIGVLAFGATSVSAAIVCNDEGDCWRTKERYKYPPEAHAHVYNDDWKWGPNDKYRWREEGQGPGYWSKGAWVNSPIQKELEESIQGPGQ